MKTTNIFRTTSHKMIHRIYMNQNRNEKNHIRQTELFEIDEEDGDFRSLIRGPLPPILVKYFQLVERVGDRLSSSLSKRFSESISMFSESTSRALWSITGIGIMGIMIVIILIQTGDLNLQTMSFQFQPSILASLGVALYTAYKLPDSESMSDIFK